MVDFFCCQFQAKYGNFTEIRFDGSDGAVGGVSKEIDRKQGMRTECPQFVRDYDLSQGAISRKVTQLTPFLRDLRPKFWSLDFGPPQHGMTMDKPLIWLRLAKCIVAE